MPPCFLHAAKIQEWTEDFVISWGSRSLLKTGLIIKLNLGMKTRNIISFNFKLLHTPVETLASLTDKSFLGNFSLGSLAMHERQMDRVVLCAYGCCLSACVLQCLKETMSFCLSFSLSWSKEKPALGTGFFGVMLQAKCSFILYTALPTVCSSALPQTQH